MGILLILVHEPRPRSLTHHARLRISLRPSPKHLWRRNISYQCAKSATVKQYNCGSHSHHPQGFSLHPSIHIQINSLFIKNNSSTIASWFRHANQAHHRLVQLLMQRLRDAPDEFHFRLLDSLEATIRREIWRTFHETYALTYVYLSNYVRIHIYFRIYM